MNRYFVVLTTYQEIIEADDFSGAEARIKYPEDIVSITLLTNKYIQNTL